MSELGAFHTNGKILDFRMVFLLLIFFYSKAFENIFKELDITLIFDVGFSVP